MFAITLKVSYNLFFLTMGIFKKNISFNDFLLLRTKFVSHNTLIRMHDIVHSTNSIAPKNVRILYPICNRT